MSTNYCIRRAKLEESEKIIDFLNCEWGSKQILSDKKYFSYYYVVGAELNFIIATKDDDIVAACGFVRASGSDVWGSHLFVKKGENPTLVLKIIKFFEEEGLNLFGVGIEKNTQELYRTFRYEVGKLKHYYKLFNRSNYKIATVVEKQVYSNFSNEYQVIKLDSGKVLQNEIDPSIFYNQRPQKSFEYMIRRYYNFPYSEYKYTVWAIKVADDNFPTIFVTREQNVSGAKVLRIVDIIGNEDELNGIGQFFEEQGRINEYEYIDCWCYGIKDFIMQNLGFICSEANIIPDRLEPLQKCNDEIYYYNCNVPGFRAFRADADMDRPNIWYNSVLYFS